MRPKFSLAPAALLAIYGCSATVDQPQAEEGAQTIECALGEGAGFEAQCQVERAKADGVTLLVVRHPDGGFRRFEQLTDGRGLVEADGADMVVRALDGEMLEVAVGTDRYRFKAQAQASDAAGE